MKSKVCCFEKKEHYIDKLVVWKDLMMPAADMIMICTYKSSKHVSTKCKCCLPQKTLQEIWRQFARHVQTECDVNRKSNSTEQIVFYSDSLLSYM